MKKPDSESLSPYDDDIDRFFNKASDVTRLLVGHTYALGDEWLKELPFMDKWGNLEWGQETVDQFFNRPYQSHAAESERPRFGFFGRSPFGLFSVSGPSVRQYNECAKKKGVSVWDTEGRWRCLFPSSEVPPENRGQVLTKEAFEEAARGSNDQGVTVGDQGRFFRQFTDYLDFRNTMFENLRLKRRMESADKADRNVISVAVKLISNTNFEDKEEVVKESRTEVFADGDSVTTTTVKRRPFGSTEWVEEPDKGGWFWK